MKLITNKVDNITSFRIKFTKTFYMKWFMPTRVMNPQSRSTRAWKNGPDKIMMKGKMTYIISNREGFVTLCTSGVLSSCNIRWIMKERYNKKHECRLFALLKCTSSKHTVTHIYSSVTIKIIKHIFWQRYGLN